MSAGSMAVNPVFYPPYFPPPVTKKITPFTPPPVATDDPPFPGTRRAWLTLLQTTWNLPFIPAQSKQSLRSFYNPKWDKIGRAHV